MKSKKRNYTHTLYNTETSFNRGAFKDIRTNRCLGNLLEKGLIFPILIRRRNYPYDTWVFMLVVVCQMGVFARTPTPFGVKTSGIF